MLRVHPVSTPRSSLARICMPLSFSIGLSFRKPAAPTVGGVQILHPILEVEVFLLVEWIWQWSRPRRSPTSEKHQRQAKVVLSTTLPLQHQHQEVHQLLQGYIQNC
ncbi:hypothetical protein M758_9G135400 [Ceratodon purpureus]|nr:hypothetical protein M758_9G135400 [Ceratodon purpureus]